MNVGIYGSGAHVEKRKRAIWKFSGVRSVDIVDRHTLKEYLDVIDILFIAASTAEHYEIAEIAAKRAVHLFLAWPPAVSIRECEEIRKVSEEAGVEAGVSRPLRFHQIFDVLPNAWHSDLILIRSETAEEISSSGARPLADVIDLCCALARSNSVQNIEAESVRGNSLWPDAIAFTLRFLNGVYAQVNLRRGVAETCETLYVAGTGFQAEAHLTGEYINIQQRLDGEANSSGAPAFAAVPAKAASMLETETHAFLQAIVEKRTVPVSILDGLQTMRLIERVMERLR